MSQTFRLTGLLKPDELQLGELVRHQRKQDKTLFLRENRLPMKEYVRLLV